ncbi:MAG: glycosyltransferase family 4 protein [Phycisphaerae bacterium]|nr:glycosyltransferase family 4 protein [Phycisphaerae bacterium]
MPACRHNGGIYIHLSFGRVIDRLAERYEKVYLCVPIKDAAPVARHDYHIQSDNIELIPQPFFASSIGSLRHPVGISLAYVRMCRKAEVLFVRGIAPFVLLLYLSAWFFRRGVCHWIVGDAVALLRSHRRASRVLDLLSLAYAWQDRLLTRVGRRLTGGYLVCNGQELAEVYRSPHTIATVSSTITDDEFFEREDTCAGSRVKILFVGFIRPEKGVEYLIEALGGLKIEREWELILVGTCGKYRAYKDKLVSLINKYGINDKVRWAGYVIYGDSMFEYLRTSDILVLPTLSEGTPRVLVEARANSLPIVATNIGGIPTSVTDGKDGVLVPPKDAAALGAAVERVISDKKLRRSLIRNGLETARRTTVDKFVDLAADVLAKSAADHKK